MRHSDDRILTTYVGSLIRPPALLQHAAAARQDPRTQPDYQDALLHATADVVARQAEAGIRPAGIGSALVAHSAPLDSLDDVVAMGQEELEKIDMCLKRHLAKTRSGWPLIRPTERMKSHASKQFAHHNSIVLQRRRPAARSELPRGCAEVQAALPALKICAVNRIRCASFDGHGFGRLPLHDPCE